MRYRSSSRPVSTPCGGPDRRSRGRGFHRRHACRSGTLKDRDLNDGLRGLSPWAASGGRLSDGPFATKPRRGLVQRGSRLTRLSPGLRPRASQGPGQTLKKRTLTTSREVAHSPGISEAGQLGAGATTRPKPGVCWPWPRARAAGPSVELAEGAEGPRRGKVDRRGIPVDRPALA